jgi:hypothetical protein
MCEFTVFHCIFMLFFLYKHGFLRPVTWGNAHNLALSEMCRKKAERKLCKVDDSYFVKSTYKHRR